MVCLWNQNSFYPQRKNSPNKSLELSFCSSEKLPLSMLYLQSSPIADDHWAVQLKDEITLF